MSAIVNRLYNIQSIDQWQHDRTMLHSSGIWGREPVLQYLADEVIRTGDVVVDLGAGAGYPTLRVAAMLGATGNVIGVDLSEAMIASAHRYCRAGNLSFRLGDISQPLELVDEYADVVTGFMVLHIPARQTNPQHSSQREPEAGAGGLGPARTCLVRMSSVPQALQAYLSR